MRDSGAHSTVVFRQNTKKPNDSIEASPVMGSREQHLEYEGDEDDVTKLLPFSGAIASQGQQQDKQLRRNFWLLVWTIPVIVVLFWLPMQEELELEGANRAKLEDRVSVLAKQPVDFVVHASSPQRWGLQYKSKPFKPTSIGGTSTSQTPCIRLFGMNETLNQDANARKSLPRIKYIRIIGERNTGTRLLHSDLQKALRNISIESGITRWGYWFQDPALLNPLEHKPEETLVVHVVLEPYEWFARMHTNPVHAPFHRKPTPESPNANWTSQTFFKRAWTCPRPEWDELRPVQGHCQYRFPYDAVMPCIPGKNTGAKAHRNYPVYEMHPTKLTPFPTIVHLRTAKLKNFLNVTSWMPHVVHVRSKDVATVNGVNAFVSALLDRYRLSISCEVHKRDPISTASTTHLQPGEDLSWLDNPPQPLTNWQSKFITCNLDWNVEGQIGFSPQEDLKTACPNGFVGHAAKIATQKQLESGEPAEIKNILFRFMDGISNLGRRRRVQKETRPPNHHSRLGPR